MATADEILLAAGEEQDVQPDVLVVDNDLRTITIPENLKILGVEGDDDVKRLRFKMPRTYGEFDLGVFAVHVVYVNANNEPDMYLVTDAERGVDEITFSWLVGENALKYKGETKFAVHLRRVEGGRIAQRFNTEPTEIKVLEGLDANIPPEAAEKAFDIIAQLIGMLDDKANAQIADINAAGAAQKAAIEAKGKATLETIPEDYKKMVDDVNQLKDTKADAIMDTSARAASHTLHAQRGRISATLYGKTTETGSGDKSPDNPYTISGVDAARVHCGGKNLFDPSARYNDEVYCTNGTATESNGVYSLTPTAANCRIYNHGYKGNAWDARKGNPFIIRVGQPYTISLSNSAFDTVYWTEYDADLNVTGFLTKTITGGSFIRTPDDPKVRFATLRFEITNPTIGQTYTTTVQVELGRTATAYEPYNANVINPPLLPDGAPLYGNGTVDDVVENDVVSGCDKTYTFNGTEAFGAFNASSWNTCAVFFASNTLSDIQGGVAPYSDRFSGRVMANSYSQEYIATHNTLATYMYFSISFERLGISPTKDVATASAALKAYLQANPLTVFYRSTDYTPDKDLRVCRTVRNFKKYVLTGDENYILISSGDGWSRFQCSDAITTTNGSIGYCSHYARQNVYPGFESGNGNKCWFIWDNAMSIADFKAKLAERYAAGNPTVIVCNINPETYMSDPLPLRKPDTLTTDTVTVTGSAETAVEYPHDTKHYIDSQIAAAVALALNG